MSGGFSSLGADDPTPASTGWKPLVSFERLLNGLVQEAGWLSGYPDPDKGYQAGDVEAEAVLASYDGLLLRLATMLEVPVPVEGPLDWERRGALVAGLAAAGIPAKWIEL